MSERDGVPLGVLFDGGRGLSRGRTADSSRTRYCRRGERTNEGSQVHDTAPPDGSNLVLSHGADVTGTWGPDTPRDVDDVVLVPSVTRTPLTPRQPLGSTIFTREKREGLNFYPPHPPTVPSSSTTVSPPKGLRVPEDFHLEDPQPPSLWYRKNHHNQF